MHIGRGLFGVVVRELGSMKRFIRTLVLALFLAYGYYRTTDGVLTYTWLYQWPGTWSLVSVEPA